MRYLVCNSQGVVGVGGRPRGYSALPRPQGFDPLLDARVGSTAVNRAAGGAPPPGKLPLIAPRAAPQASDLLWLQGGRQPDAIDLPTPHSVSQQLVQLRLASQLSSEQLGGRLCSGTSAARLEGRRRLSRASWLVDRHAVWPRVHTECIRGSNHISNNYDKYLALGMYIDIVS